MTAETAGLKPELSRFALRSRTFRIFMTGSLVSRTGDWMDLVALNWAVLQFTNSPLYLGLMNACRLIPAFLLSVPAGLLADRYDRRKILFFIQAGIMLLTFCLGYLLELENPSFWFFAFLVTLRSMLAAMDPPVRNALLPNLVPSSSLTSAIAINTMVINLSRIMGPALAGLLLAAVDLAQVFYLNAWGTLGVLFSLLFIRSSSDEKQEIRKEKTTLREAVHYIKKKPVIQSLLILAVVPMVFGFPYTTLMPVFAKDLLNLGPGGFGLLLSVSSVGAVAATAWLSFGNEMNRAGKWLVFSIIGFGFSLLLFISAPNLAAAGVAMFLVGLTSQTYRTLSRIVLQQHVPDQLRGRILSIALMDRGFIPVGAILLGAAAAWIGAMWTGMVMGLACIGITLLIAVRKRQIWEL